MFSEMSELENHNRLTFETFWTGFMLRLVPCLLMRVSHYTSSTDVVGFEIASQKLALHASHCTTLHFTLSANYTTLTFIHTSSRENTHCPKTDL